MNTFIRNHQPDKKIHSKHAILAEAKDWLEELEKDERVLSIHPGMIKRRKATTLNGPRRRNNTSTGVKYLFYAGKTIQEFFVVFKKKLIELNTTIIEISI